MPIQIKICGITNIEDALAAVDAGADALGFMFYPSSPRYLPPEQASVIIARLPAPVLKVGVFVDATEPDVRTAVACGLTAAQFHGGESPEFCRRFGVMAIKAFRIKDESSLAVLPEYRSVGAWLLDSHVPGKSGGTGERFNWNLALAAKQHGKPIFLAGGLTPANAAEAVRQVRPHGLDVSSGVETSPGKKDHRKIRDFIQAARRAAETVASG